MVLGDLGLVDRNVGNVIIALSDIIKDWTAFARTLWKVEQAKEIKQCTIYDF